MAGLCDYDSEGLGFIKEDNFLSSGTTNNFFNAHPFNIEVLTGEFHLKMNVKNNHMNLLLEFCERI
jgi:hypothetical protein